MRALSRALGLLDRDATDPDQLSEVAKHLAASNVTEKELKDAFREGFPSSFTGSSTKLGKQCESLLQALVLAQRQAVAEAKVIEANIRAKLGESTLQDLAAFYKVDLNTESHLLWIIEAAGKQSLPPEWVTRCDDDGFTFYVNTVTKETTWDHPSDHYFHALVAEERKRSKSSAAVRIGMDGVLLNEARLVASMCRSAIVSGQGTILTQIQTGLPHGVSISKTIGKECPAWGIRIINPGFGAQAMVTLGIRTNPPQLIPPELEDDAKGSQQDVGGCAPSGSDEIMPVSERDMTTLQSATDEMDDWPPPSQNPHGSILLSTKGTGKMVGTLYGPGSEDKVELWNRGKLDVDGQQKGFLPLYQTATLRANDVLTLTMDFARKRITWHLRGYPLVMTDATFLMPPQHVRDAANSGISSEAERDAIKHTERYINQLFTPNESTGIVFLSGEKQSIEVAKLDHVPNAVPMFVRARLHRPIELMRFDDDDVGEPLPPSATHSATVWCPETVFPYATVSTDVCWREGLGFVSVQFERTASDTANVIREGFVMIGLEAITTTSKHNETPLFDQGSLSSTGLCCLTSGGEVWVRGQRVLDSIFGPSGSAETMSQEDDCFILGVHVHLHHNTVACAWLLNGQTVASYSFLRPFGMVGVRPAVCFANTYQPAVVSHEIKQRAGGPLSPSSSSALASKYAHLDDELTEAEPLGILATIVSCAAPPTPSALRPPPSHMIIDESLPTQATRVGFDTTTGSGNGTGQATNQASATVSGTVSPSHMGDDHLHTPTPGNHDNNLKAWNADTHSISDGSLMSLTTQMQPPVNTPITATPAYTEIGESYTESTVLTTDVASSAVMDNASVDSTAATNINKNSARPSSPNGGATSSASPSRPMHLSRSDALAVARAEQEASIAAIRGDSSLWETSGGSSLTKQTDSSVGDAHRHQKGDNVGAETRQTGDKDDVNAADRMVLIGSVWVRPNIDADPENVLNRRKAGFIHNIVKQGDESRKRREAAAANSFASSESASSQGGGRSGGARGRRGKGRPRSGKSRLSGGTATLAALSESSADDLSGVDSGGDSGVEIGDSASVKRNVGHRHGRHGPGIEALSTASSDISEDDEEDLLRDDASVESILSEDSHATGTVHEGSVASTARSTARGRKGGSRSRRGGDSHRIGRRTHRTVDSLSGDDDEDDDDFMSDDFSDDDGRTFATERSTVRVKSKHHRRYRSGTSSPSTARSTVIETPRSEFTASDATRVDGSSKADSASVVTAPSIVPSSQASRSDANQSESKANDGSKSGNSDGSGRSDIDGNASESGPVEERMDMAPLSAGVAPSDLTVDVISRYRSSIVGLRASIGQHYKFKPALSSGIHSGDPKVSTSSSTNVKTPLQKLVGELPRALQGAVVGHEDKLEKIVSCVMKFVDQIESKSQDLAAGRAADGRVSGQGSDWALLLAGGHGSGKQTIARILANHIDIERDGNVLTIDMSDYANGFRGIHGGSEEKGSAQTSEEAAQKSAALVGMFCGRLGGVLDSMRGRKRVLLLRDVHAADKSVVELLRQSLRTDKCHNDSISDNPTASPMIQAMISGLSWDGWFVVITSNVSTKLVRSAADDDDDDDKLKECHDSDDPNADIHSSIPVSMSELASNCGCGAVILGELSRAEKHQMVRSQLERCCSELGDVPQGVTLLVSDAACDMICTACRTTRNGYRSIQAKLQAIVAWCSRPLLRQLANKEGRIVVTVGTTSDSRRFEFSVSNTRQKVFWSEVGGSPYLTS